MENFPQIAAILQLIASCRLWFQMMSSMPRLLQPINKVTNNGRGPGMKTGRQAYHHTAHGLIETMGCRVQLQNLTLWCKKKCVLYFKYFKSFFEDKG